MIKKKIPVFVSALLVLAVVLSGCGNSTDKGHTDSDGDVEIYTVDVGEIPEPKVGDSEEYSDGAALIILNGDGAECGSNAVRIDGSQVTVTDEGTYIIRGSLEEGMITVEADKQDSTTLVLDGASVANSGSAALYIASADKVTVILSEGSENSLSSKGTFAETEDNIDGAVFSKEDLELAGEGTLWVASVTGHGVVSKDDLSLTGGSITISAACHGLAAKDRLLLEDVALTLDCGKDGVHAENTEDETLGSVEINGGTYRVEAEGDGISAGSTLTISGGSFDITTGGGSENGDKAVSDSYGGFMGGMPGAPGMPGMPGAVPGMDMTEEENSSDLPEGSSIKGLKAEGDLTVTDGDFVINSADDAVHSNSSVYISGGTFSLATGDDGVHADCILSITEGDISVTESYEGLEALQVLIGGGDITVVATDDGINAAGGTDSSGTGGIRGDSFGGPGGPGGPGGASSGGGSIVISGGNIEVTAAGDGIDANGSIEISGGHTVVSGPTVGDTATLDYDTTATITGGTFIGTGAAGMAQTFSSCEQGLISVSVGTREAGTPITVTGNDGNTIVSHTPTDSYAVVIISTPDLVSGNTYTVSIGTDSADVRAS